jgi:hypothetical protein
LFKQFVHKRRFAVVNVSDNRNIAKVHYTNLLRRVARGLPD